MSWKSFVTAGLLCALAAPAFAAPTIDIIKSGSVSNNYLDANGNWVWKVRLAQTNPPVDLPDPDGGGPLPDPSAGSPLAAELGFQTTNSAFLGVTMNTAEFDDPNPGNVIFGWEDLTNLGGSGACDSATPGSCPVGLLWDGNDANAPDNQVYTAFGSIDYAGDVDGKDYATFITRGPSAASAAAFTVTLRARGTYGDGDNGRIAELNPLYDGDGTPPISINHDTYDQTDTRTILPGDADLSGDVDGSDLNLLLTDFFTAPGAGLTWSKGNFNNAVDNDIDGSDLNLLLTNFFVAPVVVGNSPGPGGSNGVPEPATMALVALAGLGLIGLRRRS